MCYCEISRLKDLFRASLVRIRHVHCFMDATHTLFTLLRSVTLGETTLDVRVKLVAKICDRDGFFKMNDMEVWSIFS